LQDLVDLFEPLVDPVHALNIALETPATPFVKYARTATYRDMERLCGTCKAWRRCAGELAKWDVQAGMDSYCLNAPMIDALIVDHWGRTARIYEAT
jgi:hypothetical protein